MGSLTDQDSMKAKIESVKNKGNEVRTEVAAMREVAFQIEAAILQFENKKLEVLKEIEIERAASIGQILSERQKSLNQIAAARDGALERIKAAIANSNTYRPAQHNDQTPLPGQFVPTAE